MTAASQEENLISQQPQPSNAGCSGPIMVLCAVITAIIAVLAFFGIRQYTDLLGPARAHVAQPQSQSGEGTNRHSFSEVPKQPPKESGWAKAACEPQSVAGSHSQITDTSISMSVDRFRVSNDETILQLLVEPAHCCKGGYLQQPLKAYIADSEGNIYELFEGRNSFEKIFGVSLQREIRLNEKYRFELVFPKLKYATPFIFLHVEGFPHIKANLQWDS